MNRSFLSLLFGKINWSSPPWFGFLQHKAKTRPVSFWGLSALIIAALIGAIFVLQWYKNLPKPQLITAVITAPKITPLEEELQPDSMTINFGYSSAEEFSPQSVAPLQNIGKEVTEGIELKPAIKGTWVWDADSRLIFTPAEDWPAGQTYDVSFSKNFFASGTKMEKYHYSFSTAPFQASISEFNFYQDPLDAKARQAVATLSFNFPVDQKSLESKISLMLQELKNGKLDLAAQAYKFTLTYDKHQRTAYLRSENLTIPEVSRFLLLSLGKGIRSSTGSAETKEALSKNLLIPDVSNYFKVSAATASIIRNEQDRPEQILNIETSLGVTEAELKKSLHVYLLPQNYPATRSEQEKVNFEWSNPGEVTSSILTLSTPLTLSGLPAERHYANLHSYKFAAMTPRYIYLKIDKGIHGFGDFALSNDYAAVIKVPEFPKEISFLHKGSLLALSGEKKLSVLVRGLPAVKFEIARVLPDNINQLVTQTEGDFNNPRFINQSFNQQNISEIFSEVQQFDASDLTKQQYSALDLSKYLASQASTVGMQGLFLLQATGWDVANNTALDVKSNRLILITDLGLLVKDNSDGSHDVFVQSITTGEPVANSTVDILGKNGLAILSRTTDAQGRVNFPSLKDFVEDREPTVYVAHLASDISFIPYNNYYRQLNFSRFDIGGLYSNQELHSLSAYLFSDRGIYRPGDTAHIGMIVKQAYAQAQTAGLPLEAIITDPRGTNIYDQKFTLDASGFLSFDFPAQASSPTGQYLINLYTVKDNHTDSFLGSSSIRVAEFQPDRMRISSKLSEDSVGWVSPADLTAKVGLWNLYGAPATDRRVSAKVLLTPQAIHFSKFPEYTFVDPLLDPDKPAKVFTDNLADQKTNQQGEVLFDLNLERFDKATYQLTFFAEGFEAEGGRSVTSQATALVSPNAYFVGYKPDGDLGYIKQNSQRSVSFIAVNPQLEQEGLSDLKIQLLSIHPVSTLVKRENGSYQYQSVIQSTVVNTAPFTLNKQGSTYVLPTDAIGEFAISILDKTNTEISRVRFNVVGASQSPLSKNAELSVKLSKPEYNAGEDIELQITAPYTGAGLVTIERDKVYAAQWFKTDTTNSVQTIRIPADFQGNGYVNVAFVRNWDSSEIFISPLSYNVVPFSVNNSNQVVHIDLDVPKLARPGQDFNISYKTDKPGKIVVFAVDEGILQVARYKTPDPVAFFFQKHALEVLTQQTVDQILPKYIRERELSSVGGDDGEGMLANHLNPFKRKTDLPVAYWSGILDADSTPRTVSYTIPDYFNGSLQVMAVAVSADAIGASEKKAEVRGDFVINPNVPTFVSPGDEFEITASIANNIEDSKDAEILVELKTTPALKVLSSRQEKLLISEGHEQTVSFRVRAKEELGSQTISFSAALGDKFSKIDSTLSVRPAATYMTSVKTAMTEKSDETLLIDRVLYPEYRNVTVSASSSPLILIRGLQQYLDNFPYGCTEQLVSQSFPLLAFSNQSWMTKDSQQVKDKVAATLQMLGQRQMSSGGFSYWPNFNDNPSNNFASVYSMHFLTEARELNYTIPNDLWYAGIAYLKDFAAQTVDSKDKARLQAYAIYLLTRNEIVTTNYLTNLQLYLDQDKNYAWQEDITGAYIASTYQLLKNNAEAERLIIGYKSQSETYSSADFFDSKIADAQYLYLIAHHFPNRLNDLSKKMLLPLVKGINNDEINTLLSSYTSLALTAYTQNQQPMLPQDVQIHETFANNAQKILTNKDNQFVIDETAKSISIHNPGKNRLFYQLTEAGFDKQSSDTCLKQGIEVYREYRAINDKAAIHSTELGSEIEVHIQLRALDGHYLPNIAIVDLLPGGFEVVSDSLTNINAEYSDVREDRVNFFTSLSNEAFEIVYRIKATNTGEFIVPAIFAESMYDPNVKGYCSAGKISIKRG